MTGAPGPKVADVQVFDAGDEFLAIDEMGKSCHGGSAVEALRGLGAALREDAEGTDAGACERCQIRPATARLQRTLDDVPVGTLDVCEACAPRYEGITDERTGEL